MDKPPKPIKGKKSTIDSLPTSLLLRYRVVTYGGLAASLQAYNMLRGKEGTRSDDGLAEGVGTLEERVSEKTHTEEEFLLIGNQIAAYNPLAARSPLKGVAFTVLGWAPVWRSFFGQLSVAFLGTIITMESIHLLDPILGGIFDDVFRNNDATTRMGEFAAKTQVFTSFFLGLWTLTTLGRRAMLWKQGVQGLISASSTLSLILATRLPERWEIQDTSGPREMLQSDVLSTIRRWSLASLDLVFRKCGWEQSTALALQQMQSEGTLTTEEVEALARTSNPMTGIWAWHSKVIADLSSADLLTGPDYKHCLKEAQGGLNSMIFLQQNLKGQTPFGYMNLVSIMTNVSVFGSATVGGVFIGKALLRTNELQALTELAICCVTALVSYATLELNLNSTNPFVNTCDAFCRGASVLNLDDTMRSVETTARERPLLLRH